MESSPLSPLQPVIHYIDRVPSGIADIDFERQPTSQSNNRTQPAAAAGNGYSHASPPTSGNVAASMMRSIGSKHGQGGPPPAGALGPTSLVGVIHDTMSSLVCSSCHWSCLDASMHRVAPSGLCSLLLRFPLQLWAGDIVDVFECTLFSHRILSSIIRALLSEQSPTPVHCCCTPAPRQPVVCAE